jgi:MinD superfamily P-loop ATPase
MLYAEDEKVFSTARLHVGSGSSGKLVTEVKKNLRRAAAPPAELAIIDGSPGIGCPVIASMSGVDMVLVVAEPSVSGISDMERILKTAETFKTRVAVCINKYDTALSQSERIESYCREKAVPFAGKIPYDPCAVKAVNNGETIVDRNCPAGKAAREVFRSAIRLLLDGGV